MNELNFITILVATFASFIFGALWYSPLLFLKTWCQETKVDMNKKVDNPGKVYGITFFLTFISAIIFAIFIGEKPSLSYAISVGGLAGIGLVGTSMGINYQFAQSSFKHWLIDVGFHVGRFVIMGLVFGLWPAA